MTGRKLDARDIKLRYRPQGFLDLGETLQDLKDKFLAAKAVLNQRAEEADHYNQALMKQRDNQILRGIERYGGSPSMACLLSKCIIITPTRTSLWSRDISEIYANRISRLEWLIRRSATQPLIYEISEVADELRILKNILKSQFDVVSLIAQCVVKKMGRLSLSRETSRLQENARDTATNTADIAAPPSSTESGIKSKEEVLVLEAIKRNVKLRQSQLFVSLEKLEETSERLKAQAALFINTRAENQNIAIFIFTIVTVIFLPLSFITSYFGMNTSDIRDTSQGQWLFWVIGGPLAIALLLAIWVIAYRGPGWRRRWQERNLINIEDWKWGNIKAE